MKGKDLNLYLNSLCFFNLSLFFFVFALYSISSSHKKMGSCKPIFGENILPWISRLEIYPIRNVIVYHAIFFAGTIKQIQNNETIILSILISYIYIKYHNFYIFSINMYKKTKKIIHVFKICIIFWFVSKFCDKI